MKRKIRMLFLVTVSLLVLAGFGKKRVELLSDKKLIDLNAAIALCLPGADSVQPEDSGKQEAPSVTPEPTVVPTTRPEQPEVGTGDARTVIISVRERVITYDDRERIKLTNLEELLRKDYRTGAIFRLVDDFAEAHVYRSVIDILEKLEVEIGISYTRD